MPTWKFAVLEERRKSLVNSGIVQQKQMPQTFRNKKNMNNASQKTAILMQWQSLHVLQKSMSGFQSRGNFKFL